MKKRTHALRYYALAALPVIAAVVYLARLVSLQLLAPQTNVVSYGKTYVRYESVDSERGEIYDRNGVLLVANEYSYDLLLDYGLIPADAVGFNQTILTVVHAAAAVGESDTLVVPEYPLAGVGDRATYAELYRTGGARRPRLTQLLFELGYGGAKLSEDERRDACASITAPALYDYLCARYRLVDEDGNALYDDADTAALLALRYALDETRFSSLTNYRIAENVSLTFIAYVKETGQRGIITEKKSARVYTFPGYASHLLGTVGAITEETMAHYLALGYDLDERVGVSGAEEAFESLLHGVDGVVEITEDKEGNILSRRVVTEPVAGKDIRLTIDIKLQIAAEDELAARIEAIAAEGKASGGHLVGEDADAGACVVMKPTTGEVLALASYPTFDLSTYVEDLSELLADTRSPLLNRALSGQYPPGSTFKPGTAAAALAEGVITPETVIVDNGIYTYYDDYQPRCWIYLNYGYWHGPQTVRDAIHNSCNIFFFECGRLLTIERLNAYDRGFGLGQATGIELPEKLGSLAGPAYNESHGLGQWLPGDTLQAAIGQSYNTFTPLQLSVYISTLVNCGTRYRAHLLHSTTDYLTGAADSVVAPHVISTLDISPDVIAVVKDAMKNVPDNGSTSRIFEDYPIAMGGKTGTAQITKTNSDNGIFVAFAPIDNPEIVVSAVVEHGASGTPLGTVAKAVFDVYFGLETGEPGGEPTDPADTEVTG